MIASLRHPPTGLGANSLGDSVPSVMLKADVSRIWNELFLGVREGHYVRLRFMDEQNAEVLALQALDLRNRGWVVVGTSVDTTNLREYSVDRITNVEMLGTMKLPQATGPQLPPAA